MSVKEVTNTEAGSEKVEGVVAHSPLAEMFSKLVSAVSRINSIGDAKGVLKEAIELRKSGKDQEARMVIGQVFDRLWNLGKVPENLDLAGIQKLLQEADGNGASKLLSLIESHIISGEAKNDPEITKRFADIKNKLDQKDWIKEITALVKSKLPEIDTSESHLLGELESFVKSDSSANEDDRKSIIELINGGLFSVVKIKDQVGLLKEKISKNINVSGLLKNDGADLQDWVELGKEAMANGKKGLANGAEKLLRKRNGSQIWVDNLTSLVSGMNKLQQKTSEGMDLREAVKSLEKKEFVQIRAMLASREELSAEEAKKPENAYYDERYVSFIKQLNLSNDEEAGFFAMLREVNDKYVDLSEDYAATKTGRVVEVGQTRKARASAWEVELDEDGIPMTAGGGVESLGYGKWEDLNYLYQQGSEKMNEVLEADENGVLHPRGFRDQLLRAQEKWRRTNQQYKDRSVAQREAMLNLNMGALFEDMRKYDSKHGKDKDGKLIDQTSNPKGYSLYEMIDLDYKDRTGVTRLTQETMDDPEALEYFNNWWDQEASFEVRRMAYEGVFEKRSQSQRMIKWNSLNEIVGVSTSIKGKVNLKAMSFSVVDKQNNSLANNELFMSFAKFWGDQGVDFRLEDILKQRREEICLEDHDGGRGKSIGTVSLFDGVTFFQLTLDDDTRQKFGVPDECKDMTYGTLFYKYSEDEKRSAVRNFIWDKFVTADVGVGLGIKDEWTKLSDSQRSTIRNRYITELDFALNYASTHQMLHTMIGNASFDRSRIELPGALAEGHIKQDDILYSKLFVLKFNALGNKFAEAYAYFDSGVRDHVTMARGEYAGMFVGLDGGEELLKLYEKKEKLLKKGKSIEEIEKVIGIKELEIAKRGRIKTETGAHTIFSGLLGKKEGDSLTVKDVQNAVMLYAVFKKSIFHYGVEVHRDHGHSDPVQDLAEWGVTGEFSTAYRRRMGDIRSQLSKAMGSLDDELIMAIDWSAYAKVFKNKKITDTLVSLDRPLTPEEARRRWLHFSNTVGEASFDHASAATKRVPDALIKYMNEYRAKYVQAFNSYILKPNDVNLDAALNEIPNAINADALPHLQNKRLKGLIGYSENMGASMLGGGSASRIERLKNTRALPINKLEVGANGLPLWKTEEIKNNKMPWDPLKYKNVLESLGIGAPSREVLMERVKSLFSINAITEEMFEELYYHLMYEPFTVGKSGYLPTLLKWLNFAEPLMEVVAPRLGITGHELRHILFESAEQTLNKVSSEIFGIGLTGGGGGGGHH